MNVFIQQRSALSFRKEKLLAFSFFAYFGEHSKKLSANIFKQGINLSSFQSKLEAPTPCSLRAICKQIGVSLQILFDNISDNLYYHCDYQKCKYTPVHAWITNTIRYYKLINTSTINTICLTLSLLAKNLKFARGLRCPI